MIRSLLLVVCCGMLMGSSCAGPRLTCANQLDGSAFGFTLSVPEAFVCVTRSSLSTLLGEIRATYSQESTGIAVTVVVRESQSSSDDGAPPDATQGEDLGSTTNAQGVMFDLEKLTIDLSRFFSDPSLGTRVSYGAGTTLPSGQNLIITVSADSDIASMRDTLDAIVATVALVSVS